MGRHIDRSGDGAASTLPRGKTLEHSFFSSTCSINPLLSTNTPQLGHVAIAPTPRGARRGRCMAATAHDVARRRHRERRERAAPPAAAAMLVQRSSPSEPADMLVESKATSAAVRPCQFQ